MTKDKRGASFGTSVRAPLRLVGIGFGVVLLNVAFVGVNCSQHGLELPSVAFPGNGVGAALCWLGVFQARRTPWYVRFPLALLEALAAVVLIKNLVDVLWGFH